MSATPGIEQRATGTSTEYRGWISDPGQRGRKLRGPWGSHDQAVAWRNEWQEVKAAAERLESLRNPARALRRPKHIARLEEISGTRLITEEEGFPHPVFALGIDAAAAALGVSDRTFRRHVLPWVREIAIGDRRLIAVSELERYLGELSELASPAEFATESHKASPEAMKKLG